MSDTAMYEPTATGTDEEAGASPTKTTSPYIENARKFLYDEDENIDSPTSGNANTLIGGGPNKGRGFGGGGQNPSNYDNREHRINPLFAACLATWQTLTSFGFKRLLYAIVVTSVVIFVIVAIKGFVNVVAGPSKNPKRLQRITDKVLSMSLSSKNALQTVGTAQYNALQWVALYDKAQLDVSDPGLMQRYALAVLYYSSKDIHFDTKEKPLSPGWESYDNWMSEKGVCIWYGVECVGADSVTYDSNAEITLLNLTDNKVSGTIPSELAGCQGLIELDLSGNELEGSLPPELSTLNRLQKLKLGRNFISSSIPDAFGNFEDLRVLDLGRNEISGTIPAKLENITGLRSLSLVENMITGKIPEFEEMAWLRYLYLDQNQLTGPLPESLMKSTELETLAVSQNQITGTVPESISQLNELEMLRLNNNNLQGTLPRGLFSLTRLTDLKLDNNDFEGSLSTSIGDLGDLRILYLASNKFTGTLPMQMGLMTDLTKIFLSNNQFNGNFPALLEQLEELSDLELAENSIQGTIPDVLGKLHQLKNLDFSGNDFTGTIPTTLGQLKKLQSMRLNGNKLSGAMPDSICRLVKDEYLGFLSADCAIDCECCHTCSGEKGS